MKFLTTIVLSLFLASTVFASPAGSTYIPVNPRELSPTEVISYYSKQYGADEPVMQKMAECESNHNPMAVGDGGRALNIYQYHKGTFLTHSKMMGEELNYNSFHDQAKLAAWISVNRPEELQAWTSYRAIKNGGTYKFYSKLLGRWFTVECKL